jgi:NAD(P)-dependent dehydrogenase (short-subunit alcohol dehydrogenase family)
MMTISHAILENSGLNQKQLVGKTAIVTGAGGGIGYQAARALLWLGANVVIAEINQKGGAEAERSLAAEFEVERVVFISTDVGDEDSVALLAQQAKQHFEKVDIVINNATIATLGLVKDLPIEVWDASYQVNLRGPLLMARAFLPDMLLRDAGVFVCVSSTGTAYMGAYETFKAAQVHLADTLDAELEGTGVCAFTIGPGLVPTETATRAIADLAPHMGMNVEEFYETNAGAMLSVEEAGTGFAVVVVYADKFRGQEISSLQALRALQPEPPTDRAPGVPPSPAAMQIDVIELCRAVLNTLKEQSIGWKERSLFERQWMLRDFRKNAGMPVEQWLEKLKHALNLLEQGNLLEAHAMNLPFERLSGYYAHLAELAKGYEKDKQKLEQNLRYIHAWKAEVDAFRWALEKEQSHA